MVLVFSSLVLVFSDLALRRGPDPAQDAHRGRPLDGVLDQRRRRRAAHADRHRPVLADRRLLRRAGGPAACSRRSRSASSSASLATTQAALLHARDELPRARAAGHGRHGLSAAPSASSLALGGCGAWAIIVQQLDRPRSPPRCCCGSPPAGGRASSTRSRACATSAATAPTCSARGCSSTSTATLDNLLIGRFLGPAALGAYAVAYNVMLTPMSQISLPLQEVLFPAFSRICRTSARSCAGRGCAPTASWARSRSPACSGWSPSRRSSSPSCSGPKWDSAVPVLQVLAWVGLLQSLQGLNGTILRAVDRTRTLFRYSLVVLVASTIAFVIGLPFGVVGVAVAYAISSTFVEPYYTWLTGRAVGRPRRCSPRRAFAGVAAGRGRGHVRPRCWHADAARRRRPAARRAARDPHRRSARLVYVPLLIWRAPEVLADCASSAAAACRADLAPRARRGLRASRASCAILAAYGAAARRSRAAREGRRPAAARSRSRGSRRRSSP